MERIVCNGLVVEGINIPQFVVRSGESACLIWPVDSKHPAVAQFDKLLLNGLSPNVKVTGTICFAEMLWWKTLLFGIHDRCFSDRYFPASIQRKLRQQGWLREVLIWHERTVEIDAQLEKQLAKFRSPSGPLILESSDAKLVSCLLCEREADITIFNQRRCTPGKLINYMEHENLRNTIIEYRFADLVYPIDKTYKNANIIPVQVMY